MVVSKTKRAWQRMLSGRRLDLLDPSALDVELEDIAHGLARVARWNGQTKGPHAFSVAQHSILVWQIFCRLNPNASPKWQQMALLHDAPEYVIGDLISPFKAAVGGDYKALEERLLGAIHLRFGLPANTPQVLKPKIKKADTIAAYFEATHLAGFSESEGVQFFGRPRGISANKLDLKPVPPTEAQVNFTELFKTIETRI
ncbi:MAG: HD family hydrolase [Rhizobiaceae bacterium]|nr:HD family hydrolase [Rhizobiaceae bacterium]